MATRTLQSRSDFSTPDARRRSSSLARRGVRLGDAAARVFFAASAAVVVVVTASMLLFLLRAGLRGIGAIGLGQLLTGAAWRPEVRTFGGLPLIAGTLVAAGLALVMGALPATITAVWVEELGPPRLRRIYRRVMELAVAIPSVVYGWLALTWLVPLVAALGRRLHGSGADVGGEGLLSAAIVLAAMIAPTVFLLSVEALAKVPHDWRAASAALGASRLQTAWKVVVPAAWRGIATAVFFGFARAAGETMAVQMVIGGARKLPGSLFAPTTTVASQIVMDMQNSRPGTIENDALFAMALVLMVISVLMVLGTRLLLRGGPAGDRP